MKSVVPAGVKVPSYASQRLAVGLRRQKSDYYVYHTHLNYSFNLTLDILD